MLPIKRIKELGWVRGEIYPPATPLQYIYRNGEKTIRVDEITGEVFTYDGGETKQIISEQDLIHYYNS